MRNVIKLLGISLFVLGLSACDGETKSSKAPTNNIAASALADQQVSLLGGKLTFTLPDGMADQSVQLGKQSNNKHIYADGSGQRTLIIILTDNTQNSLETLAERLETQQRFRDANLQIITNQALEINTVPLHRFDSIVARKDGSKEYSSVLLSVLDNQLLTMQISLPGDNPQQAQKAAEGIINTLVLKQ